MKTFKTGQTYETRSICDYDCIFSFEILRRTKKCVWVDVDGETVRRGIEIWQDAETFSPFGKYSMSAIISA